MFFSSLVFHIYKCDSFKCLDFSLKVLNIIIHRKENTRIRIKDQIGFYCQSEAGLQISS